MTEKNSPAQTLVLMSVYNGQPYLAEQLDSIFNQEIGTPDLRVRDDGSTDRTREILEEYALKNLGRMQIISGPNLGAAASFMEIIHTAPLTYDYYALSDADDVWLPSKLTRQQEALESSAYRDDLPRAVVSRMEIVDQDLGHLGYSSPPPRGFPFSNALLQTVLNGAATMFDREAMALVQTEIPRVVTMHDAWLNLVFSARAQITYSSAVAIRYRQHSSNVIGVGASRRQLASNRLRRALSPELTHQQMILDFARIHGPHLPADHAETLDRYLRRKKSLRSRMRYVMHPSGRMQRPIADLYHRLLVLVDRE